MTVAMSVVDCIKKPDDSQPIQETKEDEPVLGSRVMERKAIALTCELVDNNRFPYRHSLLNHVTTFTPLVHGVVCIIVNYATDHDQVVMGHFESIDGTPLNMLEHVGLSFRVIYNMCRKAFEDEFSIYLLLKSECENGKPDMTKQRIIRLKDKDNSRVIVIGGPVERDKEHFHTLHQSAFMAGDYIERNYIKYLDNTGKPVGHYFDMGDRLAHNNFQSWLARAHVTFEEEAPNRIETITVRGLEYEVCLCEGWIVYYSPRMDTTVESPMDTSNETIVS